MTDAPQLDVEDPDVQAMLTTLKPSVRERLLADIDLLPETTAEDLLTDGEEPLPF